MELLKDIQFNRQELESAIYWEDIHKSTVLFCTGLAILLALSSYSIISLLAYSILLILFGTVSFRIYKTVQSIIQKTNDGHPFKTYLDIDIILSKEKLAPITEVCVDHLNALTFEIRRLILVEDFVETTKFAILLYVLTYIGAWFNGYILLIIAWIGLFTLPKFYKNNREVIDNMVAKINFFERISSLNKTKTK